MPEEFSKAVVVGLVNDNQPQVFKFDPFVIESVIERLDHGDKTPMVIVLIQLFDLAVDDLVGDANFSKHSTRLTAKFDSVSQDQYAFSRLQDVSFRQFGKDDGFPTSSGQLEQ